MGLLRRVRRPIRRHDGALRDDRLFVIACDDTYAPKQYFDAFQLPRVQIHVVPTEDGGSVAKHVLDRLAKVDVDPDDERWMLLDTDHCTTRTHLEGFLGALQEARQKGIRIALSKPCFEVWLALHHMDDAAELLDCANAKAVAKLMKKLLGVYDKTRVNAAGLSFAHVRAACDKAREIDAKVVGGDNPESVTTRVYLLWESIVSKALPSQLPPELMELRVR